MVLTDTFPISRRPSIFRLQPVGKYTRAAAEEKLLVDVHEFLFPKPVLVKNIAGEYIRSDTTGEVLKRFPGELLALEQIWYLEVSYPTNPPSMAE